MERMQSCRPMALRISNSVRPRTLLLKLYQQQHRSFISNPLSSKPQTLTATRTVPYPAKAVYAVVSDVSNYSKFLPFCISSEVTAHSAPDKTYNKTWPEEASLTVGYQASSLLPTQKFVSRVYCDPENVVEAVSGSAKTTLAADRIAHHSPRGGREGSDDAARIDTVLDYLLTRWTLRAFPYKPSPVGKAPQDADAKTDLPTRDQTEVNLSIEYSITNPMLSGMVAAVAPKVAEKVMAAFEDRVKSIVDGPSHAEKPPSEGVIRPRGERP